MKALLTETPSRRSLLRAGAGLAVAAIVPGCVSTPGGLADAGPATPKPAPLPRTPQPVVAAAPAPVRPMGVPSALVDRALAARDRLGGRLRQRDRMAIVDFAPASFRSRLHLIDLANGRVQRLLVAHGSGSDPGHTGFLQRFSNEDGSEATCEGAFITDDYYVGQHGRSQRLTGVDATNSNAMTRNIVVHSAWYANKDMLVSHGKLGRSQGCFAVGETELQTVFDHLGEGGLIYASRA